MMKTNVKRREKQGKNFRSLQLRTLAYCMGISMILLAVCLAVMFIYMDRSLRENTRDSVENSAMAIANEMKTVLAGGDNMLKSLQTDQALLQEARRMDQAEHVNNYFLVYPSVNELFRSKFAAEMITEDTECSIKYVSRQYDNLALYYPGGNKLFAEKDRLKENRALSGLFDSVDYVAFLGPHEDFWDSGHMVISVVRMMRTTYHTYGMFILDYEIGNLQEVSGYYSNHSKAAVTIWDSAHKYFYSTDEKLNRESLRSEIIGKMYSGENNPYNFVAGGNIYGEIVSETTGWNVLFSMSLEPYRESQRQLALICVALFLMVVAALFFFLYKTIGWIISPLRQLTGQLSRPDIDLEDFQPVESKSHEVAVLSDAIGTYLKKILQQSKELEEARRLTAEAHYETLEAQLNPHFLYNTLAVISMTGLENGNMKVFHMCNKLSALLRYSLSFSGKAVQISDEVENIENYLYIMNARLEGRLAVAWERNEKIEKVCVPKLILQPIVENCFQHGFAGESEEEKIWRIQLREYQKEDCWYLEIANNGVPFPQEQMLKLQKLKQTILRDDLQSAMQEGKTRGYGLTNTVIRLCIYDREKAVVDVWNEGGWTIVRIGGPLDKDRPEHNDHK